MSEVETQWEIPAAGDDELSRLREALHGRKVTVLTGAGCSTASGIPDYRGPNGTWTRRKPMNYQEFLRSAEARQYFWARNYRGWPGFSSAEPNAGHRALARLQNRGVIGSLITQNVDDLHQRAGQQEVIALHGESRRVLCLECGGRSARSRLQERMTELNAEWWAEVDRFNPDGDAEIDREATKSFRVPPCERCGGVLKPDVVFFGESVVPSLVSECMQLVASSDLLFVVGSSLTVWSGFRFAKAASEQGKTLVVLNYGPTRADELADLKIEANCADVLQRLDELAL